MPPAAHISHRDCPSCTRAYKPVRKNQRLCRPCRLYDNLLYWSEARTKPGKCAVCKAAALRYERGRVLCGKCATGPWRGECQCCGTPNSALIRGEIPVCTQCVCAATPGGREAVTDALRHHLGIPAPGQGRPDATSPAYRRVMAVAEVVAQARGLSVAATLTLGKEHAGLDPTAPTQQYHAVADALEALQ